MTDTEKSKQIFTYLNQIRTNLESYPDIHDQFYTQITERSFACRGSNRLAVITFGLPLEGIGTKMIAYRARRLRDVSEKFPTVDSPNIFPLHEYLELPVHLDDPTLNQMKLLTRNNPDRLRVCQTIYSFDTNGNNLKISSLPHEIRDPLRRLNVLPGDNNDRRMVRSNLNEHDFQVALKTAKYISKETVIF